MYRSPPNSSKTLSAPQLNLSSDENDAEANVTLRCEKRRRLSGGEIDEFAMFKSEMQELLQKMFNKMLINQNLRLDKLEKSIAEMDKNIASVIKTNTDIESSINFLSEKIENLHDQIKIIKNESKEFNIRFSTIDARLNSLEKSNRITSIEIRKIPKKVNEKKNELFSIAKSLLNSLCLESSNINIRDVYRLPSRKEARESTLIVEFPDTNVKDIVIEAVKKFNRQTGSPKLNTNHFGFEGQPIPVYISDFLTQLDKRLFYHSREFAKSEGYAFCWMTNGRIYLRKKEGAPHIYIKNEEQLKQLKNKM
ncbi:unnamed protein product [Colias eurytheme]|nr:unnamed protein product [Colias eurytheme]